MERIFRGYPQALAARTEGEAKPYLLYRRDSRIPEPGRGPQKWDVEAEYWKSLYPQAAKRRQSLVDEACDRLDYGGSPMYDEYPDREFLYLVRDQIERDAAVLGMAAGQDMTQVLLVNEMSRRRRKKWE